MALPALSGGRVTPAEVAAATARYVFVVGTFSDGDCRQAHEIPRVRADCGFLAGGGLPLQGVAPGFATSLIDARIPAMAPTGSPGR